MDAADAARSNGASPEAREARSPPGPVGSPENGAKADSKDAKTTNGHSGEAAEGKSPGSTPRPGEGKGTLFLGGEWRRPIVQFVESVDDKGPNYFSMDSGDGRRPPYAGLQLGAAKKPPVTFAEKGELRKSIFSEPRKPAPAIGEPGDARRHSVPRAAPGGLLRAKPGAEEVLCDSCIGNKQKAVKSCLVCQASFCELHLKPHLEGAAFRDHPLLEPIGDFEARKCPLHGKTMELFCQTDQTCICYLCMFQEHKNHSTVTVEEAKAEKEVPPPPPCWPGRPPSCLLSSTGSLSFGAAASSVPGSLLPAHPRLRVGSSPQPQDTGLSLEEQVEAQERSGLAKGSGPTPARWRAARSPALCLAGPLLFYLRESLPFPPCRAGPGKGSWVKREFDL